MQVVLTLELADTDFEITVYNAQEVKDWKFYWEPETTKKKKNL